MQTMANDVGCLLIATSYLWFSGFMLLFGKYTQLIWLPLVLPVFVILIFLFFLWSTVLSWKEDKEPLKNIVYLVCIHISLILLYCLPIALLLKFWLC